MVLPDLGRTDGGHQPTFQEGELFEHRRQAQFVKARNLGRDMADDHPHIAALQVHIDTVARQILRLERKITFLRGFQLIDLRLAHDQAYTIVGRPHSHEHWALAGFAGDVTVPPEEKGQRLRAPSAQGKTAGGHLPQVFANP